MQEQHDVHSNFRCVEGVLWQKLGPAGVEIGASASAQGQRFMTGRPRPELWRHRSIQGAAAVIARRAGAARRRQLCTSL